MAFVEETTSTTATQTSKGGPAVPLTTEEVDEDKDGGLQRRRSKQLAGGVPLDVAPYVRFFLCRPQVSSPLLMKTSFDLIRAVFLLLSDLFWHHIADKTLAMNTKMVNRKRRTFQRSP